MSRYDEFGDMWDVIQPGERKAFLRANGIDVLLAHLSWGDIRLRHEDRADQIIEAFYGAKEA